MTPPVMSFWERHRFLLLIVGVIVTALFLVGVSMSLYNSDTAQVDLSLPVFQDIRLKASQDSKGDTPASFPSTGALNKASLDSFRAQYNTRASKITSVDSYDAAALSDEAIQLMGASAETTSTGQ